MFFDENGEKIIRIISVRKANEKERICYEPKKISLSLRLDNDIILFFKNW